MRDLKSTLNLKRNWLLGGFFAEYGLSLPLEDGALSDITSAFLEQVVPLATTPEKLSTMLDLKGRNPQDLLLTDLPVPIEDELFLFGGEIATDFDGSDFVWSPFTASGGSRFASFEGAHHITHSLQVLRSREIPDWLPTALLGRSIPIVPRFFRFGVEHFRSNFISAALGYTPSVTESFLMDASTHRVIVRLVIDSQFSRNYDSFFSVPILKLAAAAFNRALGADIEGDFTRQLLSHRR